MCLGFIVYDGGICRKFLPRDCLEADLRAIWYITWIPQNCICSFKLWYNLGKIQLPFFYIILGFVFGFVIGRIYNFCAKRIGGIEIELEEQPAKQVPA
ncbi:MAG TPA: hypothetical protein DCL35_05770 [Candidatus Omnitrophica bacterium]|nr:hypothetical protein [Candidatus Omnitrophota bacterium]